MKPNRIVGLSVLFLAISVFVSGSLVMAVHESYATGGHVPSQTNALQLFRNT